MARVWHLSPMLMHIKLAIGLLVSASLLGAASPTAAPLSKVSLSRKWSPVKDGIVDASVIAAQPEAARQ